MEHTPLQKNIFFVEVAAHFRPLKTKIKTHQKKKDVAQYLCVELVEVPVIEKLKILLIRRHTLKLL